MAEELGNVTVKTITAMCGHDVVYRHDHIMDYWNEQVYARTLALSPEEKDRYFQMITDYGDIIKKLLDDDNHVIYDHIAGNPWVNLESAAADGVIIDYDKPKQLLDEYDAWKAKQPK